MSSSKWMEDEANYFAMCLLMPEHLMREEVKKVVFDYGNDDAIKSLAKTFGVSTTAMTVRLSQLNIFKYGKAHAI